MNVLYQRLHFGITIITVKFNGALFLNGGKNLVGIIVASKSQNEDNAEKIPILNQGAEIANVSSRKLLRIYFLQFLIVAHSY